MKRLERNPGNRPLNEHEPQPPKAPRNWEPPDHLRGEARREWRRLVGPLVACGILTIADRDVFASYCYLHGLHIHAVWMLNREGHLKESGLRASPWMKISMDALALKKSHAAELGLTPSGRTRVGKAVVAPPSNGDKPSTPPQSSPQQPAAPPAPPAPTSLIGKHQRPN